MLAVKVSVPVYCLFGLKITRYLEANAKKGLRTKLKVKKALCKAESLVKQLEKSLKNVDNDEKQYYLTEDLDFADKVAS